MKTLLINGCSFGHIWKPNNDFVNSLGCDRVENISRPGSGFQRTVRTTIEWVAQHGDPGMVIIPITYAHRWEMPIVEDEKVDSLDGIWMPLQASKVMESDQSGKINLVNNKEKIMRINDLYYGLISNTVGYWDKIFTEIICLSAFLEKHKIPYVMFDMCNDFDEHLLIDHPFVQKAQMIKQNKNIMNIFSFCGNKYMWRTLQKPRPDSFNQHHSPREYKALELYVIQYITDNRVLQ